MTPSPLPYWLLYLQAVALIVLPVVAAFIAYQQFKAAQIKTILDLFERRHNVYRPLFDALEKTRVQSTRQAAISELNTAIINTKFLFGVEVEMFLNDLFNEIYILETRYGRATLTPPEQYAKILEGEEAKLRQKYSELEVLIDPYMRLSLKGFDTKNLMQVSYAKARYRTKILSASVNGRRRVWIYRIKRSIESFRNKKS